MCAVCKKGWVVVVKYWAKFMLMGLNPSSCTCTPRLGSIIESDKKKGVCFFFPLSAAAVDLLFLASLCYCVSVVVSFFPNSNVINL